MCASHTGPGPCDCLIAAAHRSIGNTIRSTTTSTTAPAGTLTASARTTPGDFTSTLAEAIVLGVRVALDERERCAHFTTLMARGADLADQVMADRERARRTARLHELNQRMTGRRRELVVERQPTAELGRKNRRPKQPPKPTSHRTMSAGRTVLTPPPGSWYNTPRPPTSAPIMRTHRGHGVGWA